MVWNTLEAAFSPLPSPRPLRGAPLSSRQRRRDNVLGPPAFGDIDGGNGAELIAAAADVGIRLVLLPVYYRRGGFDRAATPAQRRFVHAIPADHQPPVRWA